LGLAQAHPPTRLSFHRREIGPSGTRTKARLAVLYEIAARHQDGHGVGKRVDDLTSLVELYRRALSSRLSLSMIL
jgi:hypothetical protein